MKIEHRPEEHLYVLLNDEGVAVGEVDYQQHESTLSLLRAEVPIELRGQGLGAALVRGTLEAIRDQGGLTVIPVCPYIAKFIMKNREFHSLKA
jgi:uncharacterized protein